MNSHTHDDVRQQRVGGAAAIYIALALLAAMPYFLLVADYGSATTLADKVVALSADYAGTYAVYLATYVFYGLALGVLALALYDRMRAAAPVAMRAATAIGLLWSVALVASGMVWNYGMTTVVGLLATEPARAQSVWQAVEPVAEALGGAGGELLGGLWILLVSVVALRSGSLPRSLGWFGALVALAGLASVIPPLRDATMLFGLLSIAWFSWVGVVLVRANGGLAAGRAFS